jgi:hypothetical protein
MTPAENDPVQRVTQGYRTKGGVPGSVDASGGLACEYRGPKLVKWLEYAIVVGIDISGRAWQIEDVACPWRSIAGRFYYPQMGQHIANAFAADVQRI